jgi:hypothetical protein
VQRLDFSWRPEDELDPEAAAAAAAAEQAARQKRQQLQRLTKQASESQQVGWCRVWCALGAVCYGLAEGRQLLLAWPTGHTAMDLGAELHPLCVVAPLLLVATVHLPAIDRLVCTAFKLLFLLLCVYLPTHRTVTSCT